MKLLIPVLKETIQEFLKRGNNTSKVELQLIDNEFFGGATGTEGFYKFPAICRGTYSIKNKEIKFTNTCAWTAEFDWTLILSGNWNFTLKIIDLL